MFTFYVCIVILSFFSEPFERKLQTRRFFIATLLNVLFPKNKDIIFHIQYNDQNQEINTSSLII